MDANGESDGDTQADGIGDDTANDRPEDSGSPEDRGGPEDRGSSEDRGGPEEDTSARKESHFTPKQLELFQLRYESGYDLCTDTDHVAWLILNHPEDVPDEFLGECSNAQEHARSDPFQPFENEFDDHSDEFSKGLDNLTTELPKQLTTGETESPVPQSSVKEMSQSPSGQPAKAPSSSTSNIRNQSLKQLPTTAHSSTTEQSSFISTEAPSKEATPSVSDIVNNGSPHSLQIYLYPQVSSLDVLRSDPPLP